MNKVVVMSLLIAACAYTNVAQAGGSISFISPEGNYAIIECSDGSKHHAHLNADTSPAWWNASGFSDHSLSNLVNRVCG